MALDFPSSPVNNQVYGNYYYDSTAEAWRSYGTGTLPSLIPTGCIMMWYTDTPPAGWLLCNGQSTAAYPDLAAIVGATVPDMRTRVPVGKAASGTFNVASGTTGGAETHTLTTAQIPAHSHPNTLSSNTVSSSTHVHGSSGMTTGAYVGYWAVRSGVSWTATNSGGFNAPGANTTTGTNATAIFGNTDGPSATTTVAITNANNTGGDGAHNNLQPYIVLNYIIKT